MVDHVQRAEHEEPNRCGFCTVVNAVVAAVLAIVVGAAVGSIYSATTGFAAGGAVLVLSAGTMYRQGDLVPGTSELTKRYSPGSRRVSADEPPVDPLEDLPSRPEDLLDEGALEQLRNSGAVQECPESDGHCLTESFRRALHDHIETFTEPDDPIDAVADHVSRASDEVKLVDVENQEEELDEEHLTPPGLTRVEMTEKMRTQAEIMNNGQDTEPGLKPEDDVILFYDDRRQGTWPSPASLFAEFAAKNAYEETWDGFGDLEPEERAMLCEMIPLFLDTCPSCDATVHWASEQLEGGPNGLRFTVTCEGCDTKYFQKTSVRNPGPPR